MRKKLFSYIVFDLAKCHEGQMMPRWAIILRYIMFPVMGLKYQLTKGNGYDFCSDTWTINGIKFSSSFFYTLQPGQKFEVVAIEDGRMEIRYI